MRSPGIVVVLWVLAASCAGDLGAGGELSRSSRRPRRACCLPAARPDEVFVQVFTSQDFAALEAEPDGPSRGRKAVEILRGYGEVSGQLEDAIRDPYN